MSDADDALALTVYEAQEAKLKREELEREEQWWMVMPPKVAVRRSMTMEGSKTGMTSKYADIWEVEGAVDASVGANHNPDMKVVSLFLTAKDAYMQLVHKVCLWMLFFFSERRPD